jgi:hypothetical protein
MNYSSSRIAVHLARRIQLSLLQFHAARKLDVKDWLKPGWSLFFRGGAPAAEKKKTRGCFLSPGAICPPLVSGDAERAAPCEQLN